VQPVHARCRLARNFHLAVETDLDRLVLQHVFNTAVGRKFGNYKKIVFRIQINPKNAKYSRNKAYYRFIKKLGWESNYVPIFSLPGCVQAPIKSNKLGCLRALLYKHDQYDTIRIYSIQTRSRSRFEWASFRSYVYLMVWHSRLNSLALDSSRVVVRKTFTATSLPRHMPL
jgi:hypothetical protein